MSRLNMRDIYGLDKDGTKTIVVKHFPPTIDEVRFQSYLKRIFGVENLKLVLPFVGCSVAVASLDVADDIAVSDFIDIYRKDVFSRPIKQCCPELEMLGSVTGVFLENVSDCVDQSVITTYFENLGSVDDMKRNCVGNRQCFAFIIPDVCVVHSLLSADVHCISGQNLSLQPYYPTVHDDILDYIQSKEDNNSESEASGFHHSKESVEEVHPQLHSDTQILSADATVNLFSAVRPVSRNVHDDGTVYDDNSDVEVNIKPLTMPVVPRFVQPEVDINKYKSGGGGIPIVPAQSPRNVATVKPFWVRRTSPDDHSPNDDEYCEQREQSSSEADTDDELKAFGTIGILKSKDKMDDASGFVKTVPNAGAARGYRRKQRLSNDCNGGMDEAAALKHILSLSMQDGTMPVQQSNHSRSKHQSQNNMTFGKHVTQRVGSNIRSEQVDGVSVQIMKAEIAKHAADVLVNVVNASGPEQFNTTVAKSFLKVGGAGLQQMFQMDQGTSMRPASMSLVIATQSTGDLKCESVFHVKITKGSDCKQVVDTAMVEIMNKCEMSDFETVAIPPLGAGRKFRFPAHLVAKRMLKQVYKYIGGTRRNHSLKVVTIVIYDDETYHTFDDALSDIARKYSNQPQQGRQPRDHTFDDDFSDIARLNSNQPQQGWQPHVKQYHGHRKGRAPLQITQSARNYHYDRNTNTGNNVRKDHSEKVTRTKADMRQLTDTRKKFVLDKTEAPKYWNKYKPGISISTMLLEPIKHLMGRKHEKVELNGTTPEYTEIIRMINETFDAQKVGIGADATGIQQGSYRKLNVLKVERVENLELYEKFAEKIKACCRRLLQSETRTYPNVKDLPNCKGAPHTSCYGEGALSSDVHSEINEFLFFHGTKRDAIDVVCNNGFDQKLGTRDAMLGQGIYGAERSTKADQYTDSRTDRSYGQGNKKKMFLIRMILGNPYVSSEQNPHKLKKPPCTKCYKDDCKNAEHGKGKFGHFFDSVIGENGKLFREFVVYEGDLCYPEYLITYERL